MLAVVVGATNGIGYYTALGLAKNKVENLILVGRSAKKGELIKNACLYVNPSCKVHVIVSDLSLIENVRSAIKKVQDIAVNGIDILYNSAALCLFKPSHTAEGIEQSFVVTTCKDFCLLQSFCHY
eukprot:NODE_88_length_21932_cov_0.317867.p14 type:complete len:125 gc:universal NODE_88_length_21932_cov_0.317867:20207-19833(-)